MQGLFQRWVQGRSRFPLALLLTLVVITGCSLPQVSAEERLFLNLSLDWLDTYTLPMQDFQGTVVGGLSALAYDRERDRLYLLSDDRSNLGPARFYTAQLTLDTRTGQPKIGTLALESVTPLQAEDGQPYGAGQVDPEGIALSPRQSLFVASEGVASDGIPPFIQEFDRATGQWRGTLPMPARFIPQVVEGQSQGVQNNLSFEALTLNPGSSTANSLEPFRLFAATESSLIQDIDPDDPSGIVPIHWLHYQVGDSLSTLLAEHLYLLDPGPEGSVDNGLTEILALDQAGHFLALERSFGITGLSARLYQAAIGGATDTSGFATLRGDRTGIEPIRKRSLFDFSTLDTPVDNLEGMALGPRLPDGSQSLLLLSDNNFNEVQTTQLWLFRLRSGAS